MVSWQFLLIGTFAAVGAALAVGTLAALLRYHRTGHLPGDQDATDVPARQLVALWARVAVGVILAAYGIVSLQRAGVL